MPVDRVGRTEVLEILTPVWTAKSETARRLRLIIKSVMAWAMAYEYVTVNPAGEVIDAALPTMPKVKTHFRALPYPEVGAAIEAVEASTFFSRYEIVFPVFGLDGSQVGGSAVRDLGRDRL